LGFASFSPPQPTIIDPRIAKHREIAPNLLAMDAVSSKDREVKEQGAILVGKPKG
jgi:hypothetical protein